MSDAPRTGLFRTTLPLPSNEKAVPAARLIWLQTENDHGKPVVVLPSGVTDNRWTFGNRGFLVNDPTWLASLVALPPQGFYQLDGDVRLQGGVTLPGGLLVQLGFTRTGESVVFPGHLFPGNQIRFASRGAKLGDLQLEKLTPQRFKLLAPPNAEAPAPDATSD